MGNFYVNFAVRGRKPADVAACLRAARREALVGPDIEGITCFFDREADGQNEKQITQVARAVSRALDCTLLAFLNHDDDILMYWLLAAGEQIDTYNSSPGYFTDQHCEPEGGNAVQLCATFEVPQHVAAVEKVLHHSKYVFAFERHEALATFLRLPWHDCMRSYGSLVACLEDEELAAADQVDPRDFIRVEPETDGHEDDPSPLRLFRGEAETEAPDEASGAEQVSLRQLEQETQHLPFFSWLGSDKRFHHFSTPSGQRYKIARSEWELPPFMAARMWRPGDGVALYVTIRDGKITVPDPKKISDPFGGGWSLPPEE